MKESLFLGLIVGLFSFVTTGAAAEFHVTNATEFQIALTIAQSNGQDDTIYLAAGIYGGNFTYLPPGTEHKSLTITGESGISAEDIILDGQNSGGVLYLFDWSEGDVAELTLHGMSIVNGNNSSGGGGISAVLAAYNITIRNCIIRNNNGKRNGGGIYMLNQWDPPVTLTLENSLILNNAVIEDPGGVSAGGGASLNSYKGTYIIRNNIVAKNSAQGTSDPSGGGIKAGWNYDDVIHLFGNTIYGNQAGKGGGIFLQNGNTANVYNNIVYGNSAAQGGDLYVKPVINTKGFNNNYTSIDGTWTSSGENLDIDPLFVDPANNNFRLLANSPMIDKGTTAVPTPPGLPATDFGGNSRIIGTAPDIGAVEFGGISISPDQGTLGTEITLTGSEFGTKKNKVLLGNSPLKVLEWTDQRIRCSISKALAAGIYDVIVKYQATSIALENAFEVAGPGITSIEPDKGTVNEEVTIRGVFFGSKKGKVTLGGKNCKVLTWTMNPTTGESQIRFVVPKGLSAGTYELKVANAVDSDSVEFDIE